MLAQNLGLKADDQLAEFRAFLDDFGITNEKVQKMVVMDQNPLSDEELAQLSYILYERPEHAARVVNEAPVTSDLRR